MDAVFITSPDYVHYEHTKFAIEQGVNVYLEKPMAINIDDCVSLIKLTEQHQVKLMVGHNLRYMPYVQKMKEIIDSGIIGDVVNIWVRHFISYGGDAFFRDWHAERSKSCSLLLHKGCHDIDAIHYLAGSYCKSIVAFGANSVYDKLPKNTINSFEDIIPSKDERKNNWPVEKQQGFNKKLDVEDNSMI